jgi:heat shock protein HslJ
MNHRARWLITLTAFTAVALTACQAAQAPAVEGKTWVLQSIQMGDVQEPVLQGTNISATFDSAKGQVTGSAGCNHYFGDYELKGSKLSIIGPIGRTEMWCETPAGVMDQEELYLTILATAQSAEVAGDQLRISCSDGQVLIFQAQ